MQLGHSVSQPASFTQFSDTPPPPPTFVRLTVPQTASVITMQIISKVFSNVVSEACTLECTVFLYLRTCVRMGVHMIVCGRVNFQWC